MSIRVIDRDNTTPLLKFTRQGGAWSGSEGCFYLKRTQG